MQRSPLSKIQGCLHLVNFGLLSGLALFFLSSSSDFWTQLRTLSWDAHSVTITASTLQVVSGKSVAGNVTFEAVGDPSGLRFSDSLWERFDGDDAQAKAAAFIERFVPGSQHVAYLSPDKSTASLGHFPRGYAKPFALIGLVNLIGAVATFLALRSHRRSLIQAGTQ